MRISDWSSDVCSSDLVTRGSVPAGMVRVVATRSTARVDNCPDWSAPSHPNVQASTTSNFGCASQSNLAAMIADPNDLLAGKPYAGGDPNTAVKSVDAWNKAESISKFWETTVTVEMKGNKKRTSHGITADAATPFGHLLPPLSATTKRQIGRAHVCI